MEYQNIEFSQGDDHVATVTINRPHALNSFTRAMMLEFSDVWKRIRADDSIHAVVLRAAPGRAFSTGADIKVDDAVTETNIWNEYDPGEDLGPKSNSCWKPVVCAVHGLCAGGAFYWLNESDIVICSEDAQFFDPHVTYGLVSALEPIGMTYRMQLGDVMRMVLLGNDERICAQSALRMGIVSEVTAPDQLWDRAHELAATIARKPSVATQGTVRAIWESIDMPRATAMRTAQKYCQIGNPRGTAEIDRLATMGGKKQFNIR